MSASGQPRLETAIRVEFAPLLRAEGFSGTGRTFRRVSDGCIHVVNVQGSRHGGKFTINLAVQPLGIPDVSGNTPNPRTITEECCEFRRRLGANQWWEYGNSEDSMCVAVREAARMYVEHGRKLFVRFMEPEALLRKVTGAELSSGAYDLAGFGSTKVRLALVLSRLRASESNFAEAKAFAQYGLVNVGAAAALRKELEELSENDA
jgi:hypothetical protein